MRGDSDIGSNANANAAGGNGEIMVMVMAIRMPGNVNRGGEHKELTVRIQELTVFNDLIICVILAVCTIYFFLF